MRKCLANRYSFSLQESLVAELSASNRRRSIRESSSSNHSQYNGQTPKRCHFGLLNSDVHAVEMAEWYYALEMYEEVVWLTSSLLGMQPQFTLTSSIKDDGCSCGYGCTTLLPQISHLYAGSYHCGGKDLVRGFMTKCLSRRGLVL